MKQIYLQLVLFASFFSLTSASIADGTVRQNAFGGGYNTSYSDGVTSRTQPNAFGGGYNTSYSDGSSRQTRPNAFGGGYNFYDN